MKRYFIPLFFLVITSCSDSIQEDLTNKMAEIQNVSSTDSHFVSYSDVAALTKAESTSTRASSNATAEIKCITGNKTNDTLLYVCQKQEGGWTVYSSDTRVPAIVAQSDGGSFDDLMKIEGAKLWIQSIADDMAAIRQLDDDKLNFTREEIENNKAFWKSISSPDEFVKKMLKESATRGGGHGNLIDPELDSLLHDGLWVFRESYTYTEVYDSIPRLTKTIWHQLAPYNTYCPLIYSNDTVRAPAGCVAIAGAQMLYFLHNKLGVPAMAPSQAYCYGTIVDYDMDQTNPSSTIWSSMNNPGSMSAAPLVAKVGKLVGMDYGIYGSSAITQHLVENVFEEYGISCTYGDYSTGTLRTSLLSGMPVILRASSSTISGGHAFIIDQYMRTRTVTANYYTWVYDSWPPHTPIPAIPEYVEYTYTSPVISKVRMNWGWGGDFNNSWFSLTGDWLAGSEGGVFYNWNVSRHMIYGFSPIDNNSN